MFVSVFRLSTYALILFGGVIFAIAEQDGSFAMLLLMSVVASHFFTVRWRLLSLPRWAANLLSLPLLPIIAFEPDLLGATPQIALAHGIQLLQIIRLFQAKVPRDYWQIYVLGLFQVVVASLITHQPILGVLLAVYLMLAVWTLVLFCLYRESHEHRPAQSLLAAAGTPVGRTAGAPEQQFLSGGFVFCMALACLAGVGLAVLVFLALPRHRFTHRFTPTVEAVGQPITGFSQEVELGDLGRILQRDDRVMKVQLFAPDSSLYQPKEGWEPLWRGIALTYYDGRKWWQPARPSAQQLLPGDRDMEESAHFKRLQSAAIRQATQIEFLARDVLFTLQPLLGATSCDPEDAHVHIDPLDGTLYRGERIKQDAYAYRTYVLPDPRAVRFQFDPLQAGKDIWARMLRPPEGARPWHPDQAPAIRREAMRVLQEAGLAVRSASDGSGEWIARSDFGKAAAALERYLSDGTRFTYSLSSKVVDPKIDPVEDFLLNRRSGHCEYFASALALMLRSVGVPARLVNGFKGSDYNALGQFHLVRQRNAHSWVEAYVPAEGRWITLDPTPGEARLADILARRGRWRPLLDYIEHLWATYVLGYDANRQQQIFYEPARKLYTAVRDAVVAGWKAFQEWAVGFFSFPDIESFFSWRGAVAAAVLMIVACAMAWLLLGAVRQAQRWWRARLVGHGRLAGAVEFYEQFLWLMSRLGLRKSPCQTPQEFAWACQEALAASPELHALAAVPVELVRAFYAVRFGTQRLDLDRSRRVRQWIRVLRRAARVRPKKGIDDESQTGLGAVKPPGAAS